MTPEEEFERARAAIMWERARALRDARLRANCRLLLCAGMLALVSHIPLHSLAWLGALMR